MSKKLDKMIIIADRLVREKKKDPLLNFKPHNKQKPFIEAVLKGPTTENWAFTSNRWGKTLVGVFCGATMARFGDPETGRPTTGWVVSVDSNASRDIIEPMYFDNGVSVERDIPPFIPDSEIAEWRRKDKILKLKNGSIIGFKSCESKGKKFPGVEKDWIQYDEPPDKGVYDEGGIRVGAGRKLRIFGTCTLLPPEGTIGGISWLYNEIVKKERSLPHVKVFRGSIYDNPYINREEVEILENRYPEGTPQRRIRLNGELIPGIGGARVYAPFDRDLHVHRGIQFYTRLPISWMWDFNVEPMVSYVGQKFGNQFNVFSEFVLDEGNIFEMVDVFRQAYPTHGAEVWVYGDASGNYRSEQTRSSNFSLILRAMENYPVPVRLKVPERNPGVVDRINAVNGVLKDEHGMVRLVMTPQCPELIQDFEEVLSDGRGGIKKTSNRRDPYIKRTHSSDAVGYWIAYEAPPRKSGVYLRSQSRVIVPRVPGYAFN